MTVSQRSCGDCSLCCKTMGVIELAKPRNTWCLHFVSGKGCGIYETRPPTCREFFCRWIQDTNLGPEWKPSKSKMVMVDSAQNQLTVFVDPGAAGVWRREPYYSQLMQMAKNGWAHDGMLMVVDRGRTLVLLPDRIADLGPVASSDRIIVAKRKGPAGFTYDVTVQRPE